MHNFEFSIPTKIIFGCGEIKRIGEEAAKFGKKALLLTFSEKTALRTGYLAKVEESCDDAGVNLIKFFGVKSNPTVEHAIPIIEAAKKEKPDVIIALGGGSVMDCAKFIGVAAKYDGFCWDLATGKAPIIDTIPVIAIVTVAATSSEINHVSVMTYEEVRRKEGFGNPVMLPKIAILDPELTYTLPIKQTVYSSADIISHLLEAYFGHTMDWAPFQDHYCQASIRTIIECTNRLIIDPKDAEARAQMMWCASFAWCGFYPCGLGSYDMTIHILGHSLSNFYDTPHGAAMSITILAAMKYFMDTKTKKFAGFAREIFGISETDDKKAAVSGYKHLREWFKKIGTAVTLSDAGITDPDALNKMVPDALTTAKAWGCGDLYNEDILRKMFEFCM